MTHVIGLRMVNFQRYRGEHVLQLGPGTYAIIAEDEADQQRSNWLGKSTIPMALRYALEGHKPKHFDAVDEMISRGEPEMLLEVELSDGTFISRKKKRGSAYDLKVEVPRDYQEPDGNLVNSSLELSQDYAQEEIWRLIGFSADDLLNTAYAEQKQLDALVAAKGTALHDVVTGWLRLEPLVDAADAAATELKDLSDQLRVCEQRLAEVHTQASSENELWLRQRINDLELQAKDELLRREANAKRIAEHDAWLRLKERHEQAERARDEVARMEAELPVEAHVDEEVVANARATERALGEAESDYRQKRTLATGRFLGTCPVNSKTCPIADQINSDQAHNAQLLEKATKCRAVEQGIAGAAQAKLAEQERVVREHARAVAYLQRARDEAAKLAPLLEQPLPPEPDVVAIVEGIGVSLELDELRRKLRFVETALTRVEVFKTLFSELKGKVNIARASLAVLGPEGAQKRVSERAVQVVERVANADLASAGIPLSLAVRWGRETQQPARQCPQCGSAFPASAAIKACSQCLAPRGKQFKPELRVRLSHVSGAATDLAGLAFRCAAFKWLRAKRQAPWSVAVLDEPFGSLDRANKCALAAHVQALVASTFAQTFIIAHDVALLDGLQKRIVVTGRGDWSSVAVAS